jgi:hypothetical protein
VALSFEGPEGGGLACFFAAAISAQSEGVDLANQDNGARIVLVGPVAGEGKMGAIEFHDVVQREAKVAPPL